MRLSCNRGQKKTGAPLNPTGWIERRSHLASLQNFRRKGIGDSDPVIFVNPDFADQLCSEFTGQGFGSDQAQQLLRGGEYERRFPSAGAFLLLQQFQLPAQEQLSLLIAFAEREIVFPGNKRIPEIFIERLFQRSDAVELPPEALSGETPGGAWRESSAERFRICAARNSAGALPETA